MTSFITHQLTSIAKAQPLLCPIMCRTELSQATQRGTSSAFVGCSSFFKALSLVLSCLTQWSCCRVFPWSNFSTCLPATAPLSKPNHLGHLHALHQHLKMVTSTRHTASFLSPLPETTGLSSCWTQLASYSCLFSLLAPGVRMPFPPYLNGLPIGQLCPSKSLLL